MNNPIEVLWIAIKTDLSGMTSGMATAQAQVRAFGNSVKGMGSAMARQVSGLSAMSSQLKSIGRGLGVVSVALGAVGFIATRTFQEFEQSMANTFSVIGAIQDEMIKLTAYAREMGNTTIFTASQSAEAMYYLASAGYDTEQVIASLRGTLDLAAATQFNLAETTTIVVQALNAFNLEASQASRVSNTFAAIISSSQARLDKLRDSFKYIAPVASLFNISIEQTSAALGLLYNAGLEASQAGNYLRAGLLRLLNPTREARKAMNALGVDMSAVNPKVTDLLGILKEFERRGGGLTENADKIAKIFGARSVTAFSNLIRKGSQALAEMELKITDTDKATTMAKIQIDTMKGSFTLLKSAMQETAIEMGTNMTGAIRTLVDTIRDLFRGFNKLPKEVKSTIISLGAAITVIGGITAGLMLMASLLPKVASGWLALKTLISGSLGPIGLIISLALALGVSLVSLGKKTKTHTEVLQDNTSAIKTALSNMIKYKKGLLLTTEAYIELAKKAKESGKELPEDEANKLNESFERMKNFGLIDSTVFGSQTQDSLEMATKAAKKLRLELDILDVRQTENKEYEIKTNIRKVKDDIKALFADMREGINLFEKVDNAILSKGQAKGMEKYLENTFDAVIGGYGEMDEKGQETLESTLSSFRVLQKNLLIYANNLLATGETSSEVLSRFQKDAISVDKAITDLNASQVDINDSKSQKQINDRIQTYRLMKITLDNVVKTLQQLQGFEINEKELREQLEKLWEPPPLPEIEDIDDFEGVDVDLEDVEKRNELRYEMIKRGLEDELRLLRESQSKLSREYDEYSDTKYHAEEISEEELLELKKKYVKKGEQIIDANLKLREHEINRQRYLSVKEAKESELSKSFIEKLEKSFNDSIKSEREKANSEKEELQNKSDKEIINDVEKLHSTLLDMDSAFMEREENILMVGREAWLKHLNVLLDEAEATYGAFSDEYNKIYNIIKNVNDKIKKEAEDSAKKQTEYFEKLKQFDINKFSIDLKQKEPFDLQLNFTEEDYELALESYRDYLKQSLLETELYSDEYFDILNEIIETERELFEVRYKTLIELADGFSQAIGEGVTTAFDKVIEEGDLTLLKLNDIFNEISKAWHRMLVRMITDEAVKALFKLILKLFSSGGSSIFDFTGGASDTPAGDFIPTPESVDYSTFAASGAEVEQTGGATIHKDEAIVPAKVKRKTGAKFEEMLTGIKGFKDKVNNLISSLSDNINVDTSYKKLSLAGIPEVDVSLPKLNKELINGNSRTENVEPKQTINETHVHNWTIPINNPVVNDKKFWEDLTEEHIKPAFNKIDKRSK